LAEKKFAWFQIFAIIECSQKSTTHFIFTRTPWYLHNPSQYCDHEFNSPFAKQLSMFPNLSNCRLFSR